MSLGFSSEVARLTSGHTWSYNAQDWLPPPPSGEEANYTGEGEQTANGNGNGATRETRQVTVPVEPAMTNEAIDVDSINAFGPDPFDTYGCPILSPQDMETLSTYPYREMRAQTVTDGELPPLPEGFDVMPLASPGGIFVETEDTFRFRAISTANDVPVSFFGRVQRPSGYIIPFHHTVHTSTANTAFTTSPVPGLGILLGAAASVPLGSITEGTVSVSGEIGRMQGGSFFPHTLLFSGQVDDMTPLGMGGSGTPTPRETPTFHSVVDSGSANTSKSVVITPSAGKRLRITRVQFNLVASSTSGERQHFCALGVNGFSVMSAVSNIAQAANNTTQIIFSIGANNAQVCPANLVNNGFLGGSLPESLYFHEPVTVIVGVGSGFVSDSVQNMTVRYEET